MQINSQPGRIRMNFFKSTTLRDHPRFRPEGCGGPSLGRVAFMRHDGTRRAVSRNAEGGGISAGHIRSS
jgi:hypothetical protein